MHFLNIENNKILRIKFFQYLILSSRFMLFPTFKKQIGVNKILTKFPEGGGYVHQVMGVCCIVFDQY